MAPQHLYPQELRPLRRKRGLTLRYVSLVTGIPIQSLSVYERCETQAPITRLVQLAAVYQVSIDRLFYRKPGSKAS